MSYKGRDRATQPVVEEVSADFTKYTLLSLAYEQTNETIVIVTDKYWSAVNCPINVAIVPFS